MSSILTNLPQLTAATNSDWLYIVDVSDTTDNPAGSSKKILRGDLYAQITGFTYLDNTITLSLSDNSTYDVVINTMTGLTINGVLSATTYENLPLDVFVTGGSFSSGVLTLTNNSGGTFNVSGFTSIDTYTTGFTYNNNRLTIQQNNGQPDLNVDINSFTGLTIDGTISATTYENLPLDVFTTGGTYSDGTLTFTNNSGGTFNVSGLYTGSTDIYTTGGTFNNSTGIATFTNNSGGTFDVSGFFKTSDDTFTTGFTFNVSNYDLTIKQNNGETDLTVNLGILSSDITITGGTYNPTTGVATFTNNTGGTFSVSGFLTGMTDTYVSGFTYNNNNLTIKQTAGQPDLTVNISVLTGLTINGNLNITGQTTSGSISATTYYNLPLDVFTTGGTYSNGTLTFTNNSGGTFNVSGLITGDTYWTSGSTGDFSIKAKNDSIIDSTANYAVAEGRDTLASGIASHAEGFITTASGDFGSHSEGDNTLASGEASHAEGVNTIASGDYSHAEGDNTTASGIRSHAEGGYTTASGQASHSEGSLTTASGFASHAEGDTTIASGSRSHAGGNNSAASGDTSFIHSTDSKVLGDRSVVLGGQNITGSTNDTVYVPYFNIQSATTNNSLTDILVKDINGDVKTRDINTIIFTGGTISGPTNFTGGLSANTFSATTYYNLPLDVFTTGGTYNNTTGIATFTNNSGGTFNVSGFTTTTPTLSQVLSSGNTTSGYDIVISSGDTISNTGGTSSIYFGYGIEPNGVNLQSGISTLKAVVTAQELNGVSFYHTHTGTTSTSSVTIHETNGVSLQAYDNTFTDQYTTIYQTGDAIIVEGDSTIGSGSTFSGIEYLVDYSSNYSNRSLVDKEYVDNLVGTSGAYLPLSGGTVSGATNFTAGLTANTFYTEYIDFNTTATTPHQEGRIHWNDDIKSLEIETDNPNVQVQVGHEMVVRVNNQTGGILTKGTVVYINGVQGQRPTITKADYSADTTSASVIGLVAADINNSANGYVVTSGILEGLNTIAYSAGTSLYLFTGGTYSNNKPQAPDHDVRIGKVIVSNATTGSIYVNVQNGYELDELHDVRITSATTNDVLVRSSYNGIDVWVNTKTISGLTYVDATTISATTYQNLPLDVFTTGGTYNSGTGVATFTNNSGGTFTVSGFTTGGGSTFTGGTVSGATNFTGGLTANTISATTYNNLPKVGFSPINVGVCDTAPTAASTQYYYQTIGEVTTTLSKVKLWGFSGSDLVIFGIYRGTLGGSMTLIGQARGTCGIGPNELTLSAETGQNLTITAGEDLVIGYYPDGTSWRTVYDLGISDIFFGILNTGNITTMPATPTGTATGIRFACTLY